MKFHCKQNHLVGDLHYSNATRAQKMAHTKKHGELFPSMRSMAFYPLQLNYLVSEKVTQKMSAFETKRNETINVFRANSFAFCARCVCVFVDSFSHFDSFGLLYDRFLLAFSKSNILFIDSLVQLISFPKHISIVRYLFCSVSVSFDCELRATEKKASVTLPTDTIWLSSWKLFEH